jgi:pimeloyl-ACP methyl ester carboxylesterase
VTHDSTSIPLILVHGWAGSAELWRSVLPALGEQGYHDVTAIRLPGSPGDESARPATVQAAAEQLIELVEGRAERPLLVGHSLGAQVTLLAHGALGERVAGEVVIDPAYCSDATGEAMDAWADRIELEGVPAVRGFFAAASGTRMSAADKRQLLQDVEATSAETISSYLRSEYTSPDSIGLMERTVGAAARRVRPTLALHSTTTGEDCERGLLQPAGSHIEHWSGHGHYLHLEDPARFAATLAEWAQTSLEDDSSSVPAKAVTSL